MISKDVGFVIKRYNFRETSLIATLYLKKFGKINGIFKGFHTLKKEFSSSLNIFTLNEFIFYPKRSDLWLFSYADLIKDYGFLYYDWEKNTIAATIFQLLNKCLLLNDSHPDIFILIEGILDNLKSTDKDSAKLLYIFIIKFLSLSGFKPEFNLCINCHTPYEEDAVFSIIKGGMLCKKCKSILEGDTHPINKESILTIKYIQNHLFPQLLRLTFSKKCEEEVRYILERFFIYHLNYNPFYYVAFPGKII